MDVAFEKAPMFELRVQDVYDLAADIGKEFERIIDAHGLDAVTSLMSSVISSLEHLEASAVQIERNSEEVLHLRSVIKKMESDRLERAEFRTKFEHEVEQIEENWLKETNKLADLVSRLQEENHRLNGLLAEKNNFDVNGSKESATDDVKLAQRLKELVDEQRAQLHTKDRDLIQKSSDIDNLQQQVENLSQSNTEISRRVKSFQSQMRFLVEEKSELQAQVQDQQRELQVLQKKLGQAVKENMDLANAETDQTVDLRGKIVINKDDPNRPRFTLDELRHILFEKNHLKARVSELEDELALFRPKEKVPVNQEDDPPVQGPLPREPEDKLFPDKRLLGIRRFFRALWNTVESCDENSGFALVPFPAMRPSMGLL